MKNKIVFFDFDGTLTRKDSFIEFFKFYNGYFTFVFNSILLIPKTISFFLKISTAKELKEAFLNRFLKGQSRNIITKKGEEFAKHIIPKILSQKLLSILKDYQIKGYEIYIVSASLDCWLLPWCNENQLKCICTKIDFANEISTGKLATPNCNGMEKVNRIRNEIDLTKYTEVVIYGNSKGDASMSTLATSSDHIFWI